MTPDYDWSELHDASNGAAFGGVADYEGDTIYVKVRSSSISEKWLSIKRGVVFFPETADIPDGDVVTAASLFLYIISKSDNFGGLTLQVVAATPASEFELTTDDFDQFGTVVLGEIVVADIVTGSYNEIVLDPAAINKSGTTILGLRFDKDVNDDSTSFVEQTAELAIASMDNTDESRHPYLTTVH